MYPGNFIFHILRRISIEYSVIKDIMKSTRWPSWLRYCAGRPRFRFTIVSLEFVIDLTLPAALWQWGRLSLLQKWVPGIFPGGGELRRLVRRADNFATLICRLSWNLGTSTSRKPLGLSRPGQGLHQLFLPFTAFQKQALLPSSGKGSQLMWWTF